jgi:hypothetical protein
MVAPHGPRSKFRALSGAGLAFSTALALLGASTLTVSFSAPALGQQTTAQQTDRELIARLIELSQRKRTNNMPLGVACARLGLNHECLVYHLMYRDARSVRHSFNMFHEWSGQLRIIIYKRDTEAGDFFLVEPDGSIIRAARFSDGRWAALLPNEQTRAVLDGELAYWRVQQHKVAEEPDWRAGAREP